ncbi:MAG: hypothetical protein AAGG01_09965 [Planctomycetota bacterium]
MNLPNQQGAAPVGGQLQNVAETRGASADPVQAAAAGAAFRALLERLEQSARDLDEASNRIEDPRELGEAVQNARASVEEAVLAGGDLLEAYRAAQARAAHEPQMTQTEPHDSTPDNGQGGQR